VEKRYFCKNTKSGYTDFPDGKFDIFIEGKWYYGCYDGYKYYVTNELGIEEELLKPWMSLIFELNKSKIREYKINQILKNDDYKQ
jgi:hypothetical protein